MDFIAEINKIVPDRSYRQGAWLKGRVEDWKEERAYYDYWYMGDIERKEEVRKIHDLIEANLGEALKSDFDYVRIFALNIANPEVRFFLDESLTASDTKLRSFQVRKNSRSIPKMFLNSSEFEGTKEEISFRGTR